jgi:preprotein translocase subunit SecE
MQKILQFLKEVKVEFNNITWPKKEALIQLTIVVISISIVISLILGGIDFLLTQALAAVGQTKTTTNQIVIPTINIQVTPQITAPPATPSIKLTPSKIIKK